MPIEGAAARLVSGSAPRAGAYDADIIILTMGRLEETLAAVASASRQAHVTSYVALLDQGDDAALRARYSEIFAGQSCAGFYVADRNLGVGGGRNFLSGVGHGRMIVALDNDAVFADPFVVFDALRLFEVEPALGAIAFRIMDAAGEKLDARSWGFPRKLMARARGTFLTTTFVGAGHAIRRAAWEDAGGYDESLFFTWEEYDFCLAAIARGWRVEYRGELAVRHKLAAEARVRWGAGRSRLYVRNRLIIARKWGASWWGLAPRISGYLVRGAVNGGFWAALAGTAAAIKRDARTPKRKMPAAMRRYVNEHEQAHRGRLMERIGPEVFGGLVRD